MKIIIVAGGGGHFSPALGVIEKLPKDWEVLIIGRKYTFEKDHTESLEYITAKKLGIPFAPLSTGRLQRKVSIESIYSLCKIPVGFMSALSIIQRYKPDIILSFGGYVAVPVTFAARMLGVPLVLHEQTMQAGLANKIASKFADKICISFATSKDFFPIEKIVLTGNPMRQELTKSTKVQKIKRSVPSIYITGGSSGAHGINVLIEGCIAQLVSSYTVFHQTGDAKYYDDYTRLAQLRDTLPPDLINRYSLVKYVEIAKLKDVYNEADLIVSRAGINTIMEILYFGKPCVLIPLPWGQKDEQKTNAQFVKTVGLAEVEDQASLTPSGLVSLIEKMFDNIAVYKSKAVNAGQYIYPNAASLIIEVVKDVQKKKSH